MKIFFRLIILCLATTAATAGTITGNVSAQGKVNADDAGADGAYTSRKYKFVEKVDYAAMHDFVVCIEGTVGTNNAPATNVVTVATTKIAQKSATFSPHVLAVMRGATVEWPNEDTIF